MPRSLPFAQELPPIEVDGRPVPCRLRLSARAQAIRIRVRAEGVELVVPERARIRDAHAFLAETEAWIRARVRAIRAVLAAHPGSPRLGDGARVLLRGRTLRLEVRSAAVRTARVEHLGDLRVTLPAGLEPDAREATIERALCRWLRGQALADAQCFIERHGPRNGLVPQTVRIKEQQRLWGSCSGKGALNLNWRLIFAPAEMFEYVVVHELCHLEHRHHQPPFWRRVAELMPDYGRRRRWLRENGHLLTLRPG